MSEMRLKCKYCGSTRFKKNGTVKSKRINSPDVVYQSYQCKDCGRTRSIRI